MILTVSLDFEDPWKYPDPNCWFCCPLNAFRKKKLFLIYGIQSFEDIQFMMYFHSNPNSAHNSDSSQGKHESSPRQKLLSTIKKVVIEILQLFENDNQSTRVFGVRTVQNLRNIRKCEALAYNISSDVRPCRESLVRRSISFLFKYLYNRPMAKEGR